MPSQNYGCVDVNLTYTNTLICRTAYQSITSRWKQTRPHKQHDHGRAVVSKYSKKEPWFPALDNSLVQKTISSYYTNIQQRWAFCPAVHQLFARKSAPQTDGTLFSFGLQCSGVEFGRLNFAEQPHESLARVWRDVLSWTEPSDVTHQLLTRITIRNASNDHQPPTNSPKPKASSFEKGKEANPLICLIFLLGKLLKRLRDQNNKQLLFLWSADPFTGRLLQLYVTKVSANPPQKMFIYFLGFLCWQKA